MLRILVVEDDFLVADMIAGQLEDCGCEVLGPVPAVAPALELVRREPLDGALLDVSLSGERCFPIAEALQSKHVPFVFLTGYSDRSFLPPEFGTTPLLVKPFEESDLSDMIERHFKAVRSAE